MSVKRLHKEKKFWFVAVVAIIAIGFYVFINKTFLLTSAATVIFLALFYIGDRIYGIHFKDRHYLFFIAIVCMGVLASPLYYIYPVYDKWQHFLMPVLVASMVYHMTDKLNLERKWKIWYTFYIVVAIVGLWELAEYSIDQFFDFKLQGVYARDDSGLIKTHAIQEPIDDTMLDMFLGVLGASVYGIYKGLRISEKR